MMRTSPRLPAQPLRRYCPQTKIKIKPTFKKPSCSCSSAQALASGDMDAIKDEAKGAAMDSIEKVELAVFCENTPDFKVFKTVTRDKFDQMMELVDLAKSL